MAALENGEAGIRTLDAIADMPVFKTGAIGRSATSPGAFRFDGCDRLEQLSAGLGWLFVVSAT